MGDSVWPFALIREHSLFSRGGEGNMPIRFRKRTAQTSDYICGIVDYK